MKTNEQTSLHFALLAGALSLVAFIIYSWKTISGETHPNISSWAVWSFITILNFTSYKKLTGDWAKSILPTANAVMTLVILGCAFKTGTLESLDIIDYTCLVLGVIAGIVWWIQKSPNVAQIILQITLIVAFIPTFKNAYHSPHLELPISWILWTLSYGAQFYSVKYNWKGKYIEYLYPVNAGICHLIVFILSLR